MQNILTGNELSSEALSALRSSGHSSVELTPYDPPYFFFRAYEEISGNRIGSRGLGTEPFRVVEADGWAKIDLEERSDNSLSDEVLFLEDFGLATMGGSEHVCHVNPLAIEMFYRPGGYFDEPDNTHNITQFLKLMRDYVLPGQYWRSYYAAAGLPEEAGATYRREMFDVEAEWRSLVEQIGKDEVEDDAEYYAKGEV
jgi:hypothetical protein